MAFVYDLDLPDYRYRMILQVMPPFSVAAAGGGCGIMAWVRRTFFTGRTSVFSGGSLSGPAHMRKGS